MVFETILWSSVASKVISFGLQNRENRYHLYRSFTRCSGRPRCPRFDSPISIGSLWMYFDEIWPHAWFGVAWGSISTDTLISTRPRVTQKPKCPKYTLSAKTVSPIHFPSVWVPYRWVLTKSGLSLGLVLSRDRFPHQYIDQYKDYNTEKSKRPPAVSEIIF